MLIARDLDELVKIVGQAVNTDADYLEIALWNHRILRARRCQGRKVNVRGDLGEGFYHPLLRFYLRMSFDEGTGFVTQAENETCGNLQWDISTPAIFQVLSLISFDNAHTTVRVNDEILFERAAMSGLNVTVRREGQHLVFEPTSKQKFWLQHEEASTIADLMRLLPALIEHGIEKITDWHYRIVPAVIERPSIGIAP